MSGGEHLNDTGHVSGHVSALLRIAKRNAAVLQEDLADIARARAAARASLAGVDDAPHADDEARNRRLYLIANLATLEDAEASARAAIEEALAEVEKLEGLVGAEGDRPSLPTSAPNLSPVRSARR
ncbi:MAG: hypothetical protein AAGA09_06555 [Pseudomonadota bacterium]